MEHIDLYQELAVRLQEWIVNGIRPTTGEANVRQLGEARSAGAPGKRQGLSDVTSGSYIGYGT